MSHSTGVPSVLLVEPQFVLRRTVVAVARELGIGHLHEATSSAAGLQLLATRHFDGLVLDTGPEDAAFELLRQLRAGTLASPAGIVVVALVQVADAVAVEARIAPFGILALVRKPFKVAELLRWVALMGPGDRQGERPPVRSAARPAALSGDGIAAAVGQARAVT